jgi:hypothetical protein
MKLDMILDFLNLLKDNDIPIPEVCCRPNFAALEWKRNDYKYVVCLEKSITNEYYWFFRTEGPKVGCSAYFEGINKFPELAENFLRNWRE